MEFVDECEEMSVLVRIAITDTLVDRSTAMPDLKTAKLLTDRYTKASSIILLLCNTTIAKINKLKVLVNILTAFCDHQFHSLHI